MSQQRWRSMSTSIWARYEHVNMVAQYEQIDMVAQHTLHNTANTSESRGNISDRSLAHRLSYSTVSIERHCTCYPLGIWAKRRHRLCWSPLHLYCPAAALSHPSLPFSTPALLACVYLIKLRLCRIGSFTTKDILAIRALGSAALPSSACV